VSDRLATTQDETPVFFPAPSGDILFGIHTKPTADDRGIGVVIVQGGDTVNVSMHRNRLAVRLARELAADGYHSIRFDYHGLGESSGQIKRLHLHHPFTDDVEGAANYLSSIGLEDLVLMGACFGSRTALSSAPKIPGVRGLILATPPSAGYDRTEAQGEWMARSRTLGDYVKGALKPTTLKQMAKDPALRSHYLKLGRKKLAQVARKATRVVRKGDGLDWVSPMLLDPLDVMVQRNVPVLFIYGTDDPLLAEFNRARAGRLGRIMDRSRGRVTLHASTPGVMHGFPSVPVQEAFVEQATAWIKQHVPAKSSAK
jgi:pimeloyl-ACP methyl ester carboxylesterase